LDIFKIAAQRKLRFDTPKGQLTAEDLYDLPLQSTTGAANLDDVAKGLNKAISEAEEGSFVSGRTTASAELNVKFDIVKAVIQDRLAAKEQSRTAGIRKAERERIDAIIAAKQDAALEDKSLEELVQMRQELTD
jgi:hypothetical protein